MKMHYSPVVCDVVKISATDVLTASGFLAAVNGGDAELGGLDQILF